MRRYCQCCKTEKDRSEFGVSRSRKDGVSPYCKACNRDKTNRRRGLLPSHRPRRRWSKVVMIKGSQRPLFTLPVKPTGEQMASLVLAAIDSGSTTQRAIYESIRKEYGQRYELADMIGLGLCELFERRAIVTKGEGETRKYFRKAA